MANSRRRCALKSCGTYFPPTEGVCNDINAWCSPAHQYEHAMQNRDKQRRSNERQQQSQVKAERRQRAQAKQEFRANDVTLQKKLTQTVVNKLVSLLDKDKPCISCGRPLRGGRYRHASHFKSIGSNSFLRYCLLNIHDSCVPCNKYNSGNIEGYRAGLIERYGHEVVTYLDTAPRMREWECDELINMRTQINAEIRRLEKGLPPSKDWRSLLNPTIPSAN